MSDTKIDTDILIVGAGPVGLFLANECARRGLRWRLVEARSSQSEYSKALAIFPRTLEIFDMAGLIMPFLERANRVTSVAVMTHGRTLARMQFAPQESPYSFVAMVPQDVTEHLLVEQLQRTGGKVEYETVFVSAVERGNCVNVTLDRKGELTMLKTSFVVGCDGAHSAVRHLLSLSFEGAEYNELFMLADIETNEGLPADQLQLCPSESGPVAIFPISATRRRIVAIVDKVQGDAPSLDLVREILAERAPNGIEAHALHYGGSPIVEGAGERYFDDSLRGGLGIRSRFLLLCDRETDPSSQEAAKRIAQSFSDIVELRLRSHAGITLVRPDGYIAYSAHSRDGISAMKSVQDLLERQTMMSVQ